MGPSHPQLCSRLFILFTFESLAIVFQTEHVKKTETAVKLLKIIKHTFRSTTKTKEEIKLTDMSFPSLAPFLLSEVPPPHFPLLFSALPGIHLHTIHHSTHILAW